MVGARGVVVMVAVRNVAAMVVATTVETMERVMMATKTNPAMVKESLMQDPFPGVAIWMQLITMLHLHPPIVDLIL